MPSRIMKHMKIPVKIHVNVQKGNVVIIRHTYCLSIKAWDDHNIIIIVDFQLHVLCTDNTELVVDKIFS